MPHSPTGGIILLLRLPEHFLLMKKQIEGFQPTSGRLYFAFTACGTLLDDEKAN
jgi:hypothetical protein